MKKIIYISVAVGLLYLYLQYRKIMQYTIEFKNINFKNISLGSINGDLQIVLFNPTAFQAVLQSFNFDIYVNDRFITVVNGNTPLVINAKTKSIINADFYSSEVLTLSAFLAKAFTDKDEPTIKIKGAVKIEIKSGKIITVPVNMSKPLSYFTEQ